MMADTGSMFAFRLTMIQSEPETMSVTINRPKTSAITLKYQEDPPFAGGTCCFSRKQLSSRPATNRDFMRSVGSTSADWL